MGFFDFFRRKNAFEKIQRSEVVDAIIQLEKQQDDIISTVEENNVEVKEVFAKGKAETDQNMKLFYAKKIEALKRNNAMSAKRLQFIITNITAMYNLKNAMDDKEFLQNNSNVSLNEMLSKPAELQSFLTSINATKMKSEEQLVNTLETFDLAESSYTENEDIYGVSAGQDSILSMFAEDNIATDMDVFSQVEQSAAVQPVEDKRVPMSASDEDLS